MQLSCGHSICEKCLFRINDKFPFDRKKIDFVFYKMEQKEQIKTFCEMAAKVLGYDDLNAFCE